jgi:hypothetical protein
MMTRLLLNKEMVDLILPITEKIQGNAIPLLFILLQGQLGA